MFYEINITKIDNGKNGLLGYATVTFGGSLKVRNIKLFDKEGNIFIDLPKIRNVKKNEAGEFVDRLIAVPHKNFAKELYENIKKVYKSDESYMKSDVNNEFSYSIQYIPFSSKGNVLGVANICIEDSFNINGFTVMNGKNGIFINNPKIFFNDEYKDIAYPITAEFREELHKNIMKVFNSILTEDEQNKINELTHQKSVYQDQLKMMDGFMDNLYEEFKGAENSEQEDRIVSDIGMFAISKYQAKDKIALFDKEINEILDKDNKEIAKSTDKPTPQTPKGR